MGGWCERLALGTIDLVLSLPWLFLLLFLSVEVAHRVGFEPPVEEIHRLIPGSELVIFEKSGHMPQVEEPEAFVRVVREFLHRPGGTA